MNNAGRAEGSVSVCVPVLNGMPYLCETIDSIIPQLQAADELIVIDNASRDGTSDYLRSLADPRVRVVFRETTQSAADNWTQAITETRGQFVKLVCGDDVLEPGCLEIQREVLGQNSSVVLVAGKRTVVDQDNEVLIRSHGLNGLSERMGGTEVIRRCLVEGTNLLGEPAAVLFRGEAIRAVMPWERRWPYVLDIATYARLATYGDFHLVREPLAKFRVSTSSWSSQILNQQPKDFRGWRLWQRQNLRLRWTWRSEFRAEVNLRVRSMGRRYFFWKAARKAKHESFKS